MKQGTIMNKLQLEMVYVAAMAEALRRPAIGCFSDFRTFVMRGNVLDLAVAVIIGGAFNNVINTLVTGIITPALLNPALRAANITDISELSYHGVMYGSFLAAVISFFIISLVLFIVVKLFENSRRNFLRLILEEQSDSPFTQSDGSNHASEEDKASGNQRELLDAIKELTKAINVLSKKDSNRTLELPQAINGGVSTILSDELIPSGALNSENEQMATNSVTDNGPRPKSSVTLNNQNPSHGKHPECPKSHKS